jgi:hypothetical protein
VQPDSVGYRVQFKEHARSGALTRVKSCSNAVIAEIRTGLNSISDFRQMASENEKLEIAQHCMLPWELGTNSVHLKGEKEWLSGS